MKTHITHVHARRIWDSRGRPTVEVDVMLQDGSKGTGMAPAGASRGSREALELRDGGELLNGLDVSQAVSQVNHVIAPSLVGMDALNQSQADQMMIELDGTPNKSRLGANGMIATSLAIAQAAAESQGQALWQYLSQGQTVRLPLPQIQIFGGGAHAKGSVDLQDFLAIPNGASSFTQSLEWVAEVYHAAGKALTQQGKNLGVADEGGFWPQFGSNEAAIEALVKAIESAGFQPGRDVSIGLDLASTQYHDNGVYHWRSENRYFDRDQLLDLYTRWAHDYPIISMEDGFAEDDIEGMCAMTHVLGHRLQIIGDDFFVTHAPRIEARARLGACNAVLIKPNQVGTVSETKQAFEVTQQLHMDGIISARSGETEDVSIVHMAVGWGVAQLKVGSFSRSERMAKWNEGLRIEQDLGRCLAYPRTHLFPWLAKP